MQMTIDKAKKHGVGFVVVRNSTHYGIAGYYTLMATQNGCVGWAGTNARPSITPTYGVEPMLGKSTIPFYDFYTYSLFTHYCSFLFAF